MSFLQFFIDFFVDVLGFMAEEDIMLCMICICFIRYPILFVVSIWK